jgi:hypothetical protein
MNKSIFNDYLITTSEFMVKEKSNLYGFKLPF